MRVLDRLNKDIEVVDSHPHSYVAEALRLGVREHDLYFRLNSNYLLAWSALSSHADVDIKPAISTFNKLCKDVHNSIPFMRFDKVEGALDSDLQRAIDQYKRMEKAEKARLEKAKKLKEQAENKDAGK